MHHAQLFQGISQRVEGAGQTLQHIVRAIKSERLELVKPKPVWQLGLCPLMSANMLGIVYARIRPSPIYHRNSKGLLFELC